MNDELFLMYYHALSSHNNPLSPDIRYQNNIDILTLPDPDRCSCCWKKSFSTSAGGYVFLNPPPTTRCPHSLSIDIFTPCDTINLCRLLNSAPHTVPKLPPALDWEPTFILRWLRLGVRFRPGRLPSPFSSGVLRGESAAKLS